MPFLHSSIICYLDKDLKSAESIEFGIVELSGIIPETFVISRLKDFTLVPSVPSTQFLLKIKFSHQEKYFCHLLTDLFSLVFTGRLMTIKNKYLKNIL